MSDELNPEQLAVESESDHKDDSSLATLSGILAGFSVTGVIEFSARIEQAGIYVAMFIALLAASMLFLTATLGVAIITESMTLLQKRLRVGEPVTKLRYRGVPRVITYMSFFFGLIALLVALGMAGFLFSSLLGYVSAFGAFMVVTAVGVMMVNLDL